MSDEFVPILREAIQSLKQVTGKCNNLYREFCPHILGTKDDDWNCLVWQFDGDTSSEKGLPKGGDWRCFELRDLEDLKLRDGDWYRGWAKGRGEQHCVDEIDTVVDSDHAAEIRHT